MVYFATSTEWQQQSALLLQARPTTTRITTKYKIPNLDSPKYQKTKKRKRTEVEGKEDTPKVPQAVLVLKAYDPESGVCLKFKTDRAAEVGRLINGLGRSWRQMAALPEKVEEVVMEDVPSTIDANAPQATAAKDAAAAKTQQPPSGANKKKKKGKK